VPTGDDLGVTLSTSFTFSTLAVRMCSMAGGKVAAAVLNVKKYFDFSIFFARKTAPHSDSLSACKALRSAG
jgi:hypothetical protein